MLTVIACREIVHSTFSEVWFPDCLKLLSVGFLQKSCALSVYQQKLSGGADWCWNLRNPKKTGPEVQQSCRLGRLSRNGTDACRALSVVHCILQKSGALSVYCQQKLSGWKLAISYAKNTFGNHAGIPDPHSARKRLNALISMVKQVLGNTTPAQRHDAITQAGSLSLNLD